MVALYKIKLKLNMSNKSLAAFCGQMEETLIGETIYEVAICHFQISCQIPRKWLNPKMSDEDKDVIFNHFLSTQDPIYTQHLAPMKDPTGRLNLILPESGFLLTLRFQINVRCGNFPEINKHTGLNKHIVRKI